MEFEILRLRACFLLNIPVEYPTKGDATLYLEVCIYKMPKFLEAHRDKVSK